MSAYFNSAGLELSPLPLTLVRESLSATLKKLDDFGKLKARWSFGEGRPFDKAVIDDARALANHAANLSLFEIDVFPGLEGEISVCLYRKNVCAQFEIQASHKAAFRCEAGRRVIQELPDVSIEAAKIIISRVGRNPWLSRASLTQFTSTVGEVDSTTTASNRRQSIPNQRKLSQLLTSTVP